MYHIYISMEIAKKLSHFMRRHLIQKLKILFSIVIIHQTNVMGIIGLLMQP